MGLGLCLESGFGDRLSTTPAWVALWRIAAVLTLQIPSKLSCMHAMSFAGPHTGLSLCMLTLVPHNRHNMGGRNPANWAKTNGCTQVVCLLSGAPETPTREAAVLLVVIVAERGQRQAVGADAPRLSPRIQRLPSCMQPGCSSRLQAEPYRPMQPLTWGSNDRRPLTDFLADNQTPMTAQGPKQAT